MTKRNLILQTDSYKYSHLRQYPEGTEYVSAYIEARGGENETVFFGLQAFLKEYLIGSVVSKEDVDEAEALITAHGEPFYRAPWDIIVTEFGGKLPVEISAVREGTVMAPRNVQLQITNTDPRFFWLPSFLETMLLRAVWYPSTVATKSRKLKKIIAKFLEETSDVPVEEQIGFKLHDFGARGASSSETAMLGAMGHLVNFMGTDTVEGLVGARRYYGENVAGFSIPASEHSTITSWGKDGELEAYSKMLDLFGGPGKLVACVSDSYDIDNAVLNLWGGVLKEKVEKMGGTLVVRPDSGDPVETPVQVILNLMSKFGYTINQKGYKVLPYCVRVIQGDGINENSLVRILDRMKAMKLSTENIGFGMGGGLLQAWDRDTLKYAMKTSAIRVGHLWRDVYKDPTDKSKISKRGRLALIKTCGLGSCGYQTIRQEELMRREDLLVPVFRDGHLLYETTFQEIRDLAK